MFRGVHYFFKRRLTTTKAVVQYEKPWYIRTIALVVAFVLGMGIMVIAHHFHDVKGLHILGNTATEKALAECQASIQNSAQLNDKIDQAQLIQLSEQIEKLQAEKTQLKEDLAICGKFSDTAIQQDEAKITELTIQRDSSGVYRYTALITHTPPETTAKNVAFEGELFLSVDLVKTGKTITIAGRGGIMSPAITLSIKQFERFSGTFKLPDTQKIRLFRARIRKNGQIIDTRTMKLTDNKKPSRRK